MKLTPYRKLPISGRNKPCPCGSGKKIKHCCLNKVKTLAALPPHRREQFLAAQVFAPIATPITSPPIVIAPTGPVTVEEAVGTVSEEAMARVDTQVAEALSP